MQSGQITFGSFNNLAKMNGHVVKLWSQIINEVPGSQLLLKSLQLLDPAVCELTWQRFHAQGVERNRIILRGTTVTRSESLATYNLVDIALDSFPYNGTTTTMEGLWMGVPFITRRGNSFLSHVGESIAINAGLADWIAEDDDDYVTKAVSHANNLAKLAALRAGLRQQVLASPLFDAPRFARNFENALWGMWENSKRG